MDNILIAVITGGFAAAIATAIGNICVAHVSTKSDVHEARMENTEQQVKEINQTLKALKEQSDETQNTFNHAIRTILQDRIKYLSRAYIRNGQVDYDDRRDLIKMHEVYHNVLGGNGDLDSLMEDVKELPIK